MIESIRRWIDPFIVLLVSTMLLAVMFPATGSFAAALDTVKVIAIGLLFFVYGLRIPTREAIEGLKNWKLHGAILTATYILFPILGLACQPVLRPLLGVELATGILFLTVLPSTVQSSVAFTSIAKGNVAAAICGASLSNILGMFATPMLVALVMRQTGVTLSLQVVVSIVAQMLAPFVLGQLLQPWVGGWVRSHLWVSQISDRATILLVVYTAFSAGIVAGIWTGLTVVRVVTLVMACTALLSIVLAATWWSGTWLKFPRADHITLLMCGSKKSLATGVPMASVLFTPQLAAVVTLPVMVFHQIQLIACAIIARRLGHTDPRTVLVQPTT